jgi:hypothetical protein
MWISSIRHQFSRQCNRELPASKQVQVLTAYVETVASEWRDEKGHFFSQVFTLLFQDPLDIFFHLSS